MIPIALAVAGVLALLAAAAILRSFGRGYRIGRLLAVAPLVSVAEAIRIARAGERAYVRIDGRIDSEDEFEDADHRPLVLRRTTLRARPADGRGSWTTVDVSTEQVDFVVREGMDEIGVAIAELGDGLVVVPRVRRGHAGDLGEGAPEGVPADAELTHTVEQVSTVEHALVAGVPRVDGGRVVIGAGLGRPLLLTTLEREEAMRVLTGGASTRARLAIACLVAAAIFLGGATIWLLVEMLVGGGVASALAASPDPTLRPGGDTRTPGVSPGFVGQPLFAIGAVLALGIASLVATLVYVRLGGERRRGDGAGREGP